MINGLRASVEKAVLSACLRRTLKDAIIIEDLKVSAWPDTPSRYGKSAHVHSRDGPTSPPASTLNLLRMVS